MEVYFLLILVFIWAIFMNFRITILEKRIERLEKKVYGSDKGCVGC